MPTGFSSHSGGNHNSNGNFGEHYSSSIVVVPDYLGGKIKRGYTWFLFFMFAVIGTILVSFVLAGQYSFMANRESDFVKFQNLVQEGRLIKGKVKEYEQGGENKWLFTYTFVTDDEEICEGYSYAVYNYTELTSKYYKNKSFDLVAEQGKITSSTETVPADFSQKTLTDDGDYISSKNSIGFLWITVFVVGAVAILCLTMGIFRVVHTSKQKEIGQSTQTVVDKTTTKEEQEELRVCEYCGSYIPPKSTSCPNCGANQKK